MLTLGVDLAWQSPVGREPNETGVIALEDTGAVMDADWVRGIDAAVEWVDSHRLREPVCFVDAPLVVNNENGQRWCEKEVGRHYGSDYVSANSTNLSQGTARLGGVRLNRLLTSLGWQYDDGRAGPSKDGLCFVECYPYTTLVGALGFSPRPAYKRRPTSVPSANWPSHRAAECRRIVEALETTAQTIAPISLSSHRVTADLLGEVPTNNSEYKHFEDLLDAVLCAWTAQLWLLHGLSRCQALHGLTPPNAPAATIIVPFAGGGSQPCSCAAERP